MNNFSKYAALLGAGNSLLANNNAQDALEAAGAKAEGVLNPYLQTGNAANSKLGGYLGLGGAGGSAADILAASPGYQFQLDQGNQALDRQQAAKGNFFSGSALKASQDYAQGLANQTANDYYSKLAAASGAGQQAATSTTDLYGSLGTAKAGAGISSSNILNQLLARLSGSGASPYAGYFG